MDSVAYANKEDVHYRLDTRATWTQVRKYAFGIVRNSKREGRCRISDLQGTSTGILFFPFKGKRYPARTVLLYSHFDDANGAEHARIRTKCGTPGCIAPSHLMPPGKTDEDDGFPLVYFVQGRGGGPIKIGFSARLGQRIESLQTAAAKKLVLLAALPSPRRVEKALHAKFCRYRMKGEWFWPAPELIEFIQKINREQVGYNHVNKRIPIISALKTKFCP